MLIKAIATDEGLNLIKDDLKNNVKKFCLFGATTATDNALEELMANEKVSYEKLSQFKIYENDIHSCYYDENGFLTFELEIDYYVDLQKYIYGVALINEKTLSEEDENGVLQDTIPCTIVSLSNSGKIFKSSGVGGLYIYKVNVTGNKAEIIYQNNDYINLETVQMMDADILNRAKIYADERDEVKLNAAIKYADTQDEATLTEAKEYADIGDSSTLESSKDYVDEKTNAIDSSLSKHISNKSNPHSVTKAQVGLGNVDNTADSSKSVNYANSSNYSNSSGVSNGNPKFPNYTSNIPYSGGHTNHYAPADGWIWFELHGNGSCGLINNVQVTLQTTNNAIFTPPMPIRAGWSFRGTNTAHFHYNA